MSLAKQYNIPAKKWKEFEGVLDTYLDKKAITFECIGYLDKGVGIDEIIDDLKKGRMDYNARFFTPLHKKRKRKDALFINPPEVKEGETPCPKCGSLKTITIEMQTRSMDEGFTYELHCFNTKCKKITK